MKTSQCPHCGDGQCYCEPIPTSPESNEEQEIKEHVFQTAGLGEGPFQVAGYRQEVGPKRYPQPGGTVMEVGSPGQPMGSCKYCGASLLHVFSIRSSDGKVFDVGSSCVEKTGDAGLKKVVARKVRELKREARLEKEALKIEEAEVMLSQKEIQQALGILPHPMATLEHPQDFFKTQTLLDWTDWMMSHAGNSGKLRVLGTIKAVLRTADEDETLTIIKKLNR